MLTIFKILDHDDYWLALQKPGDVPNLFLFTYRDESPRWDILPIIRNCCSKSSLIRKSARPHAS